MPLPRRTSTPGPWMAVNPAWARRSATWLFRAWVVADCCAAVASRVSMSVRSAAILALADSLVFSRSWTLRTRAWYLATWLEGGQELGFDLAGDQESGRQRNGRHDEDPQHPAARHNAILLDGEITDFRAFAGVVSKSANGGRNARFR